MKGGKRSEGGELVEWILHGAVEARREQIGGL
jgi:hypothetical protein